MRAGIYKGLFSMAAILALSAAAQANELKLTLVTPPAVDGTTPAVFELSDKSGTQDVSAFTFQTFYNSSQVDHIEFEAVTGLTSLTPAPAVAGAHPGDASLDYSRQINWLGGGGSGNDDPATNRGPLVRIKAYPVTVPSYSGVVDLKVVQPDGVPDTYIDNTPQAIAISAIEIPEPAFAKPAITDISTNYVISGSISGNVTLNITGTNFIAGRTVVQLPATTNYPTGLDVTPTVVSATSMTADVPQAYLLDADGASLVETLQVFANNNVADNTHAERSEDDGVEDNLYVVSRDKVWVDNTYAAASPEDVVTIADSGAVPTIIGANAFATVASGTSNVNVDGTVRVKGGTQYVENAIVASAGTKLEGYDGASVTAPTSAENSALVSVQADNVSITGMDFDVNTPDAVAGVFMGAGRNNLTVVGNTFDMTGNSLDGNLSSLLGFNVQNAGVLVYSLNGQVTIAGNRIGTAASPFSRGIWSREAWGTIGGSNYYGVGAASTQGNVIYGLHHDVAVQFVPASHTMLVSHNDFNGWGNDGGKGAQLDFTEPNGGSVSTVSFNRFNPQMDAFSGVSHLRNAMVKNSSGTGSVSFQNNEFNFGHTGLLSANSLGVSVMNNIFTPQAWATDFTAIELSNKVPTNGTPAPRQIASAIQGNTFNGLVAGTSGVGIEFMNYNAGTLPVGGYYGVQTIGGAGALANIFSGNLNRYIKLNNESGSSLGSSKPEVANLGGSSGTNMVPFAGNMDVSENEFAGVRGSAFTVADGWAAEDKIDHKLDVAALGIVRTKAGEIYVTDASDSIQRGVNAAVANDTVNVQDAEYIESNIIVDKALTVLGQSRNGVKLFPAGQDSNASDYFNGALVQNGFVVRANDVTIEKMTIDGFGNTSLPAGYHFRTGIIQDYQLGSYQNLVATDLTIQNIYRSAIKLGGTVRTNVANVVTGCSFTNIAVSYGIFALNGDTNVVNNNFHASRGVLSNYSAAIHAPLVKVSGNTFTNPVGSAVYFAGASEGSIIGGPNPADKNTFDYEDGVNGTNRAITVTYATGQITVENNDIYCDNAEGGIRLYHNEDPSKPVIVRNNLITSVNSVQGSTGQSIGIWLTDDGAYFGDEDGDSYATISGNTISGFVHGINLSRMGDNPIGGRFVQASITNDNTITNCEIGIKLFEVDDSNNGGYKSVANILNNSASIENCDVAIDVDGASATIQGNTISNNDLGIKVQNNGVANVGDYNNTDPLAKNVMVANAIHFAFDTVAPASTVNGNNMADKSLADVTGTIIADAVNDVQNCTLITVGSVVSDDLLGEADTFSYVRSTIQGSIDAAPNGGHTVYAMADVFEENVAVNKSVHVTGDDSATVVVPAVSNVDQANTGSSLGGSQVFVVGASDVEISHLVVDGDNPNLATGYNHGGANIDARNGIIGNNAAYTGLKIHNCEVKNIYLRAIYSLSASNGAGVFDIRDNVISNANANDTDPGSSPIGTSAIAARGGDGLIENNIVTDGDVWTNYARTTGINGNNITRGGITVNNNHLGVATVQGNTLTDTMSGIWAFNPGGGTFGPLGSADVFIRENTISDFDSGISVVAGANNITTIENNELANAKAGATAIYVTDDDFGWGMVNPTAKAVINNNKIASATSGIVLDKKPAVTAGDGIIASGTGNFITGGISYTGQSDVMDFSGNYFVAAGTTNVDVNAVVADNIDYTPYLNSAVDSDVAMGFQGEYSHLHILANTDSPQSGSVNRLNEAVTLLADSTGLSGGNRLIDVEPGSYSEMGNILSKAVKVQGRTGAKADAIFSSPGTLAGSLTASEIGLDIKADNVTVQNLSLSGYKVSINRDNTQQGTLLSNLAVRHSGRFSGGTYPAGKFPAVRLSQLFSETTPATALVEGVDFFDCGFAGLACFGGSTEIRNNNFSWMEYQGLVANTAGSEFNNYSGTRPQVNVHNNTFMDTEAAVRILYALPGSIVGGASAAAKNTFYLGVANGPKAGQASVGTSIEWAPVPVSYNDYISTSAQTQTAGTDGQGGSIGVFIWDTENQMQTVNNNSFVDQSGKNHNGIAVAGQRLGGLAGSGGAAANMADAQVTISANTFDGLKNGVKLYEATTAASAITATINNNNEISNCNNGVFIHGAEADVNVSGNSASIHGNTVGVNITGGSVVVDNNHIYDNATGIQIAASASASVTNNDFDGASDPDNNVDVSNSGTLSSVTDNAFAASRDSDPKYIVNTSAANVDATDNTYSGNSPAALNIPADNAALWSIENKLRHRIDVVAFGFVRVKEDHVFATAAKGVGGSAVIQRAVSAADPADTVNVQTGLYQQIATVPTMIKLTSADGPGLAVIDGPAQPVLNLNLPAGAGDMIVDGFTIKGTNGAASNGIVVLGAAQSGGGKFTIQNCTFTQIMSGSPTASAIAIQDSVEGVVAACSMTANKGAGIVLVNSANIDVLDTNIVNNRGTAFAALDYKNAPGSVYTNGLDITGVTLDNCVIADNGKADPNTDAYGVFFSGANGAAMPYGSGNSITSCTIRNNAATGVWLTGQCSDDAGITSLYGNDIDGNGTIGMNTDGVKIRSSRNTSLANNYIRNNVRAGVLVASVGGEVDAGEGTLLNFNHIYGQTANNDSVKAGLLTQLYGAPGSTNYIDAENNWWGHVYGPVAGPSAASYGFANAIGRGDAYEPQSGAAILTTWYGKRTPLQIWYAVNDRDGDGIKDADEDRDLDNTVDVTATDPGDAPETTRNNRDSDADTYEDGVEVALGFDPLNAASHPNDVNLVIGSTADSDTDGFRDFYEVAFGTDPLSAASKPSLADVNQNGTINAGADLTLLRQILVSALAITDPSVFQDNMDLNRDGAVSNIDAIGLRRFIDGTITTLPMQ